MLLSSVFLKFQQQKPFCVMARGALERMWSATRLDGLFESTAVMQYQREVLFSQLVELIGRVVTRVDRSVLKSYEAMKHELKCQSRGHEFRSTKRRILVSGFGMSLRRPCDRWRRRFTSRTTQTCGPSSARTCPTSMPRTRAGLLRLCSNTSSKPRGTE